MTATACVILAGGQGKRMASTDCHKVCFPVGGVPAIVRAIDSYKQAGLRRFIVVVGQMADQVMATVTAAHPDVSFVYQSKPLGTGHAAQVAVEALVAQGGIADVLITMGDKLTRPEIVRALLDRAAASDADLLLTTLPKEPGTSAGRIVRDDEGTVRGIVEGADIRAARANGTPVNAGGLSLSADEVEAHSDSVNASLYLFRFARLRPALAALRPSNAQGELYLTDTVATLVREGRVEVFAVTDPHDLMAFNTPAELLAIEDVVRARGGDLRPVAAGAVQMDPRTLRPAGEWVNLLSSDDPALTRELRETYGPDPALRDERRQALLQVATAAAQAFGEARPLILARAPGRINLMGRHVDHRGGFVNVMAIDREFLLAAAPRRDDTVTLLNLDADRFPPRQFRIADLLEQASWADWMDFVASVTVREVLDQAPGDWSHYARAPLLRLQHERPALRLRGMDCLAAGNIPTGAGLSSSSAVVVAMAEAAVMLNGVDIAMRDFIDLCGEGEWFVGSRGGSADHAAIRTSKRGCVSRIGFFPFRLEGEAPLPDHLRLVIADSGTQARKSEGARDTFNQRVACYELAERLLRNRWPAASGIEHLRDLDPMHLGVSRANLYQALQLLPEAPTRTELDKLLPDEDLARIYATHAAPADGYDLRGVALFGIAECRRSEQFAAVVRSGDLGAVARLMRASHDGDRCWECPAGAAPRGFRLQMDDAALDVLAAANADPIEQPGRYACSTREIDHLVDLACRQPGVIGAQLAGAGLGGCMMILVEADHAEALLAALGSEFYAPRESENRARVCQPVAGAGVLRV